MIYIFRVLFESENVDLSNDYVGTNKSFANVATSRYLESTRASCNYSKVIGTVMSVGPLVEDSKDRTKTNLKSNNNVVSRIG